MADPIKHSSMPATDPERFEAFSVPAALPAPACRWAGSKARSRLCLFSSAVVILLGGAAGTHGEPVARLPVDAAVATDRIADSVSQASRRFAIPSAWIWAVMRAESLGDADALSPKGAMGLMQIMPGTWSELRSRYGLGADPYDPHDNVMAGAAYLRELHDRFGKPGFLAAYNAGPGRYEEHLATGRPLAAETLSYMAAVALLLGAPVDDRELEAAAAGSSWISAPIFVSRMAIGFVRAQSPVNAGGQDGASAGRAIAPSALAPPSDGLFVQTFGRTRRP